MLAALLDYRLTLAVYGLCILMLGISPYLSWQGVDNLRRCPDQAEELPGDCCGSPPSHGRAIPA